MQAEIQADIASGRIRNIGSGGPPPPTTPAPADSAGQAKISLDQDSEPSLGTGAEPKSRGRMQGQNSGGVVDMRKSKGDKSTKVIPRTVPSHSTSTQVDHAPLSCSHLLTPAHTCLRQATLTQWPIIQADDGGQEVRCLQVGWVAMPSRLGTCQTASIWWSAAVVVCTSRLVGTAEQIRQRYLLPLLPQSSLQPPCLCR